MANTKITLGNIADDAVGLDQLNISNDPSNGQVLSYSATALLTWTDMSGGVDGISSSADATAITIDSSEQVGIGITSPSCKLNVVDTSSADATVLRVGNGYTTDAANDASTLMFQLYRSYSAGINDSGFIKSVKEQAWDASDDRDSALVFGTRDGASNPAERMRISSVGNVGIGGTPVATTSGYDGASLHVQQSGTGSSVGSQVRLTSGSSGHAAGDGSYISHWGDSNLYIANQENANIKFYTNGSERMRLLSGGGITFNGDSAAANALDDYEEGTWTPTYSSVVSMGTVTGITNASGDYVKIGQMVHLRGQFTLNGSSGTRIDPGDCVRITGLPYKINDRKASGTVYTTRAFTNTGGFTGAAYWYASSYAVIQFLGQGSTVWSGDQNETVYFSMNFRDINN